MEEKDLKALKNKTATASVMGKTVDDPSIRTSPLLTACAFEKILNAKTSGKKLGIFPPIDVHNFAKNEDPGHPSKVRIQ